MSQGHLRQRQLWPVPVTAAVGALVGVLSRRERRPGRNVWDQVMAVAADPYLVLYCLLPLVIVIAYRRGEALARDAVRVRCGSHTRWLHLAATDVLGTVAMMALVLLLGALATLDGLPWEAHWSEALLADAGPMPMSPLVIVPGGLLAWVLGATALMLVVVAARARSAAWSLAIGPALWFVLLVSFRTDSPIGFLSFPFRLPGILARGWGWSGVAGALAAIVCFLVVAAALSGAGQQWRHQVRSLPIGRVAGALMIVAAALAMALLNRTPDETWVEGMWRVFYGGSPERPLSLSAMFWLVVFVGVVYGFLVRLDRQLETDFSQWAVRYGSARRWWQRHLPGWFVIAAVWPLLATLTAAVALVGADGPPSSSWSVALTLWHVTMGNILQVMVCVLVVALARWLAARSEGGLVALGVIVVLSAFRVPPFGLSAASWLVSDPTATLWITPVLLAVVVALTWFALLIVDRKGSP